MIISTVGKQTTRGGQSRLTVHLEKWQRPPAESFGIVVADQISVRLVVVSGFLFSYCVVGIGRSEQPDRGTQ